MNIAFIGFGTVGQGLAKMLNEKKAHLKSIYGFEYKVVGIVDLVKGSVYSPDGIDLGKILSICEKKGKIGEEKISSIELIKKDCVDVIIEVTPTNLNDGEPGMSHMKEAFKNGKHVVTTNKGPIALAYKELKKIADKNDAFLKFEGTVLSGTPAINLATMDLAGVSIKSIEGILNGTTNYILTEIEKGKSYEEVLKKAQNLGYAEADPTADVEGYDALAKIVILAKTVMNGDINIKDVPREGITEIKKEKVESAIKNGKKMKLIARAWREGNKIMAKVSPEEISTEHPLANVNGVLNAITFTTGVAGEITIIGPGAGGSSAGYALLTDLLSIHRMKNFD